MMQDPHTKPRVYPKVYRAKEEEQEDKWVESKSMGTLEEPEGGNMTFFCECHWAVLADRT